jgi:hypothetical protein
MALGPKATDLQQLEVATGSSDVALEGSMSPLLTLLMSDDEIQGNFSLRSKKLVVGDFMSESEATEETAGFTFPANTDLRASVTVGELVYEDVTITNFVGKARLKDQVLTLTGVEGDVLGGRMRVDGTVATPTGKAPTFDLSYAIAKAQFSKAFEALRSFQRLAPISKFMTGSFSTKVKTSGALGEDMLPKLDTLDVSGLLSTLNSELEGFPPLQMLAKAVPMVPAAINLPDVSTRFRVDDGFVEVREFPVRLRDTTMTVSGSHGLNQEMDYVVQFPAPIDKLRSSELTSQVKRLGIDASKLSEVNVVANITGSIKQPKLSLAVQAPKARQAVEEAVKETITEAKEEVERQVSERADEILAEARARANQIKAEARKAAEQARKEGYKKADQIEAEGKGNALKRVAAEQAAKATRRTTDEAVDRLIEEAEARAEEVMKKAEKEVERLQ